ncbi:MAG: biotin/lipoyl-binding protein, partial [Bryobacteraceae bacterium]
MNSKRHAARYLAFAVLLSSGCSSRKEQPAAAFSPVPVSVALASQQPLADEVRAVGNVEPFQTVQVKSQAAGELLRARFAEGGDVEKGALLFEIDDRPYRQALRQAEAALARDEAQLAQAEANLARDRAQSKNAAAEAERWAELFKQGVASRTQYDQTQSTADASRASVRADEAAIESYRAMLESDRSAIERAKLDLGYCQIRSPLSGRAGNLLVHPGNLVKADGDNALVVINQIAPVFVGFGVPEQKLGAIRSLSGGRKLPVEASPQDDP